MHKYYFLILLLLVMISSTEAQTTTQILPTQFDPSKVEIMVVGSLHLRQLNPDSTPVAVEMIRQSLQKYKPDQIVVEWLHPSIDPATTFNYRPFGDFKTLALLWGYDLAKVSETLELTKTFLQHQKQLDPQSRAGAEIRIELGKLYYLNKDQLNAGYQWWLAQQLGADVHDLRRLTRNNFKGHELEVFGFEIARTQGLEHITGFDYQGTEAGSEVWGNMLDQLRALAIKRKQRVSETDATWKEIADKFNKERSAFEEKRDKTWAETYGDIKEVREYIAVLEGFDWANAKTPTVRDGLAQMRWFQSPEYQAVERKVQTEMIPSISINNLGRERYNGFARRNELMVNFAESDIKRFGTKRVMIIVGAQHKFILEDLFRKRGYQIVSSANFMP